MDRGTWASYSPRGHKESDMTEHRAEAHLAQMATWRGLPATSSQKPGESSTVLTFTQGLTASSSLPSSICRLPKSLNHFIL